MVGVVIAAHGELARELLQTAEFIVGKVERIRAISIDPSLDVKDIQGAISRTIKDMDDGTGVLILTDMFGGTPANMTLPFLREGAVEVVTGVNLPMLIRLCQCRDGGKGLSDVAREALEYGRKSINQASAILAKK